jgi:outer membrane receptor protein involved in Fe transport
MRSISGFLWGGILLLAAAPEASSQEADDLEVELFFAPAETVESAARHIQPLSLSPSAVTVLTREDIEASGARTLPELLRLVPNMDINLVKPMWYTVGVRGGTSNTSDTMLLMIDGRDATMEFFGFPLWAIYPISMDEVERIEVIRGPGSALYGANAFAGVVHVITRDPGEGPAAAASVRGGEHGQTELTLRGSGVLGPLALSAGVSLSWENQWTGRVPDRDMQWGWIKSEVDLGEESSLLLEMGSLLASTGTLSSDMGEIQYKDALYPYVRSRFEYQELMVQFVFQRLDFDLDLGMDLFYKSMNLVLARIPSFNCLGDTINVQAQHTLEIFNNRFTYGAEYVFNRYDGIVLIPSVHYEHRGGIYLQDELNLSGILRESADAKLPPIILTAGLRFDVNSVTEWELSPRASVVYMPAEDHSLRLGYAHAFLKPTFFETSMHIHLDDVHNYGFDELNIANESLGNQSIDSLELGYSGEFFDGRLVVRIDLAYNWYSNLIEFKYDPESMEYIDRAGILIPDITGPGMSFENVPEGRQGHDVELQVIVRPTDRSRLFFQSGYRQVFDNETGLFSNREPVWNLVAGADLSGALGLTASLRAFYTDGYRRELPDMESVLEPVTHLRIPANWYLNARLAWKLSADLVDLTLGVEGFDILGFVFRQHAGATQPNASDYGAERLSRRLVFFMRGQIW